MYKEPLALIVFIHKDLEDYSKDELYEKHFSWLAEEIENISGRKMLIVLIRPSDAEELSNHAYQDVYADRSLDRWKMKINNYRKSLTLERRDPRFNKYLLLTRHPINKGVLGVANCPGYVGIASTIQSRTPAHEVGHMFNAVHEDGDILYNGWWSETVMSETDVFSELRHDANRFSDKNRENIRAYLDPAHPPYSGDPKQSFPRPYDEDEDEDDY